MEVNNKRPSFLIAEVERPWTILTSLNPHESISKQFDQVTHSVPQKKKYHFTVQYYYQFVTTISDNSFHHLSKTGCLNILEYLYFTRCHIC